MTRASRWIAGVAVAGVAGVAGACFTKPDRVGVDPDPDARPRVDARHPDASPCSVGPCLTAGGQCEDGTCVITGLTTAAIHCPDDMPCRVECLVAEACRDGVDCGTATTCEVTCAADRACREGGVDCGAADQCTVHCEGKDTCQHGAGSSSSVECGGSVCDVTCDGDGACSDGIDVGGAGSCTAHCCEGGCPAASVDPACTRDMVCS